MPRRLLPVFAAVLVALSGLAVLGHGVLRASAGVGSTRTVGHLSGDASAEIVTTAPGVIDPDGSRLRVTALAPAGRRLFVGVGRSDDVAAYLGEASRAEITGVTDAGRMTVLRTGAGATPPDPATVDVWAAGGTASGSVPVSLEWPDTPGEWRVVVASDGPAPADVTLSWTRRPGSTSAPGAIALGLLLLTGGLVTARIARDRLLTGEPGTGRAPAGTGATDDPSGASRNHRVPA